MNNRPMNNDLISREALKDEVRKHAEYYADRTEEDRYNVGYTECACEILDFIDNAPTVDIKDEIAGAYNEGYMCGNKEAEKARPQGEWKHIGGDEWVCSECGHVITTEGSWEKPLSIGAYHCENCGADMRPKGGAE